MKVINIHKRKISTSIKDLSKLFETLATKQDAIWPKENWPAMRFKDGLKLGSKGGHGRVRYTIVAIEKGQHIKFKFTAPKGFIGTHELSITSLSNNTSEISHVISMKTSTFKATLLWSTTIRWLHDALIEDAFDKVENHFSDKTKVTDYSFWVRFLRNAYKKKSFKVKHA